MNGAGRKEWHGSPKSKRALVHILRRDGMADIDDFCLCSNSKDHALHDPYKAIAHAKVGGESNDAHVFSAPESSLCFFKIIRGGCLNWGARSLDQEARGAITSPHSRMRARS